MANTKKQTEQNKEKKRCALYGRVSTDRQARIQDGGLDTQFDLMRKYIEYENAKPDGEWQISEEYREEGQSGKDLDRPEFKRMMADVEAGKVSTIIVHKLDRISRSVTDFLNLLRRFQDLNVEFVSLNERFDTSTAQGRMALTILLAVAQMERELTSERTKATMRYRASQGLTHGGRYYGYDLDPENKGVLVVNEEWARIINRDFFDKCTELGSARAVTRHLRKIGIKKPEYETRRGNRRGGKHFALQDVVRVLQNKVYLGKIVYEDQVYEGKHPAIVDEAKFKQVREILDKNRRVGRNERGDKRRVHLLRGILRCGKCGGMLTPKHSQSRGSKHYYYSCTTKAHSAGAGCDMKYIPADAAEELVLGQLRKLAVDDELLQQITDLANGSRDGELEELKKDRRSMRKRLQEADIKISSLISAIEAGTDPRSLQLRINELEDEKASLADEIEQADGEIFVTETETVSAPVMAAESVSYTHLTLPTIYSV